jgi:hypothetical protein
MWKKKNTVSAAGHASASGVQNNEAIGSAGLHHRANAGDKTTESTRKFDVETAAAAGAPGKDVEAAAGGEHGAVADAAGGSGIVERVSYCDIAKQFSLLGWSAFGGPAAHIGIMQKVRVQQWGAALMHKRSTPAHAVHIMPEKGTPHRSHATPTPLQRLVDKLHWMSTEVYAEIFALAQCMPGPSSTQARFGERKGSYAGATPHTVSGLRERVRYTHSPLTSKPRPRTTPLAPLLRPGLLRGRHHQKGRERRPAVGRAVPVPRSRHHDRGGGLCGQVPGGSGGVARRAHGRCADAADAAVSSVCP